MGVRKTRDLFFAAAAGTMTFAVIYELFSHQVYSNYMIFAFLIPLLGGAVPYTLLSMAPRRFRPITRTVRTVAMGVLLKTLVGPITIFLMLVIVKSR